MTLARLRRSAAIVGWACTAALVLAFVLGVPGAAATLTFRGPTDRPQSRWSDPANWSGGRGCPDGRNDVGVLNAAHQQVTYDAKSSGVLGGMQISARRGGIKIVIDRDVQLDPRGRTGNALTPAGWLFYRADDSNSSYVQINRGKTLTLTGLRAYAGRYDHPHLSGQRGGRSVLRFVPDAAGKAYLYIGGIKDQVFYGMAVDFSAPSVIECMDSDGTAPISGGLTFVQSELKNPKGSRAVAIGRRDGRPQRFAAKTAAGKQSGRGLRFRAAGLTGAYGPHLVVNAVGTDARPNRVVFEGTALGSLVFADSGDWTGRAGGWVEAAGEGVARLVIEGDFLTADNANVSGLWDMTRIQLQMDGRRGPRSPQRLRWCGRYRVCGAAERPTAGFRKNYAVARLIIGSDQGGPNHVAFCTTPGGNALYTYGLEFRPGGYLTLGQGDFIFYLGRGEMAEGIPGGGLTLPRGKTLGDVADRPDHIICIGEGGSRPM